MSGGDAHQIFVIVEAEIHAIVVSDILQPDVYGDGVPLIYGGRVRDDLDRTRRTLQPYAIWRGTRTRGRTRKEPHGEQDHPHGEKQSERPHVLSARRLLVL